jgi:hypothetical protein
MHVCDDAKKDLLYFCYSRVLGGERSSEAENPHFILRLWPHYSDTYVSEAVQMGGARRSCKMAMSS